LEVQDTGRYVSHGLGQEQLPATIGFQPSEG